MKSNRQLWLAIGAIVVLVFAVIRLVRGARPATDVAPVNDAYLAALVEGAIEAASTAEGAGGVLVALAPDRPGSPSTRDRELARVVRRAATRAGFERAEIIPVTLDQMGMYGGVTGDAFLSALRAHPDARAVICFAGVPLVSPEELRRARGSARLVVVEEDPGPGGQVIRGLLAAKAVDAVIQPRGAIGADAGRDAATPLAAFHNHFEVRRQ